VVDGGAGTDALRITGTAAANALNVVFGGTTLTSVAGLTVANLETFRADLLGGADTLGYAGTTAAVNVNLGTGSASGFTSIAGIENVTGGSGNDTLTSAAGVVNQLNGAAGNDTYVVHETADVVIEVAGGGTDEVRSFASSYTMVNVNVENLTFVGAGNFSGTGNLANNVITGGAGNDTLNGGAGDDTVVGNAGADSLIGSAGNDTLRGGAGNDALDGGLGNDVFVFEAGFGTDRITGFDANATGGQDLLDLRPLGITAANFNASVSFVLSDIDGAGALDTLITIGTGHIEVLGVNGVGANAISQGDFILA
jgi:Ca2+-binding RTX toxin-like protein